MSDAIEIQPPVKNEVRLSLDDVQHWVTITLTHEGLIADMWHEDRGLVDTLCLTWGQIAEMGERGNVPEPVQPPA